MSEQKPIQIFSNLNENIGVNVVKSPVKLTILEMLRDSEMEFDEIVNNTGKSKSTVSVHLKNLRENGRISYRVHPDDNRKKIFYINSKYLGSVNISEPKEIEEERKELEKPIETKITMREISVEERSRDIKIITRKSKAKWC